MFLKLQFSMDLEKKMKVKFKMDDSRLKLKRWLYPHPVYKNVLIVFNTRNIYFGMFITILNVIYATLQGCDSFRSRAVNYYFGQI
jgi:hypothetical protein